VFVGVLEVSNIFTPLVVFLAVLFVTSLQREDLNNQWDTKERSTWKAIDPKTKTLYIVKRFLPYDEENYVHLLDRIESRKVCLVYSNTEPVD